MTVKNRILSICMLCFSLDASAQFLDTVSMMHYNLLNYRNHYNECDTATNNPQEKDKALHQIVSYYKPSLLTFNEIGNAQSNIDSLLSKALSSSTGISYLAAPLIGSGFIVNALFYDQDQFIYHSSDSITRDLDNQSMVRDIDVHQLYFNNPGDLARGDTSFVVVYIAHFKAGSSLDDQLQREKMASAVMNYHSNNHASKNYLLAGDLNLRSSAEQAYQTLVQHSNSNIRFYDPIERSGAWNSNSTFADIHTQSTRSASTNSGCFSGGGLDDRFDFILCGSELLNGTLDITYLVGSYKALGNDGLHFNKDILSPSNASAPEEIIAAIYDLSDHLPVYLELEVNSSFSAARNPDSDLSMQFIYGNRSLKLGLSLYEKSELIIIDQLGRVIKEVQLPLGSVKEQIELNDLEQGSYFAILQQGANLKTINFVLMD